MEQDSSSNKKKANSYRTLVYFAFANTSSINIEWLFNLPVLSLAPIGAL